MDPEQTVDRLIESGVFRTNQNGSDLELTESFRETLKKTRAELDSKDDPAVVQKVRTATSNGQRGDQFARTLADDIGILAEYCTLGSFLPALSHEDLLQLLSILDLARSSRPPSEGVPDAFVPVRGDRMISLVRLHPAAIVYVWRHDCEPCKVVKQDFDMLLSTAPENVALYAVYGPDWAVDLDEAFDIVGAPTVLLVLEGDVDLRLQGSTPRSTLNTEIGKIKQRADGRFRSDSLIV